MAINFPDNPTHGQSATLAGKSFTYDSDVSGWNTASVSSVNLSSIPQDILPDADSSRSLGSSTKKWKDLHLSGNTIFLGDSGSISTSTGGEIILPSIKIGTGDNAVKLEADATGKLKTKSIVSGVTQAAEEPGNATVLSDMAGLIALTGMSAGQTALVTSLNKVFMYTGSGWFLIATMTNSSPTAITGVDATYSLATDGTATTITAVSSDPEGFPLTWSYAVTTGSLGSTATVSQADNVFTITPSTTEADAGVFSITFSVTDGATGAVNAVSAFTLGFTPPLPTSGMVGYYDMKYSSSYSTASSNQWYDISGNYNTSGNSNGPNLTLSTSLTTYNSSGTGGIPSLTLAAGTNAVYVGPSYPTNLTNTSSPYDGTVVMILAKPASQTWFYLMSTTTSQGAAIQSDLNTLTSLAAGTAQSGSWFHNAASSVSGTASKLYLDKVDATAYTKNEVFSAFGSTANADKYHSVVLTNGHFLHGWSTGNIHAQLVTGGPIGELRAVVFYNRALTSSEIDDVHDHFAGDYTSSEMAQ